MRNYHKPLSSPGLYILHNGCTEFQRSYQEAEEQAYVDLHREVAEFLKQAFSLVKKVIHRH